MKNKIYKYLIVFLYIFYILPLIIVIFGDWHGNLLWSIFVWIFLITVVYL
jgi:hypothetical protein